MRRLLCFLGLQALVTSFAPSFRRHDRRSQRISLQSVDNAMSCDVAVFGGGFGGLYTALAISREARLRNKQLDIALVEPTESFVFLPLLYDLTVGTATEIEVCPFYTDLLKNTGVRHIQGTVKTISADGTAVLQTKQESKDPLEFRSGIVAVGASPDAILGRVPGALDHAQPFYTAEDAKKTRRMLKQLEEQGGESRIAVVGGGFGGVELAASIKRRFRSSDVTLLSKGAPMAGTRAELLVDKALEKLGVKVLDATVEAIERRNEDGMLVVESKSQNGEVVKELWDTVLWTAGSGPADPVPNGCNDLEISASGRLSVDPSLRCIYAPEESREGAPCVWALGDCAEIKTLSDQPATPRTAQAAMQQAEVVASNVLAQLDEKGGIAPATTFAFQDLGSMLTLGGPNGAMMAPRDGTLAPIFAPLLDTLDGALGAADKVVSSTLGRSSVIEQLGLSPETLGLSLGSHGIGVDTDGASQGTLAGTLTGAARRAVYAVRMPTNQQRAVSIVSAAISTAAALAKEAESRNKN